MLRRLVINNIALIEKAEIEFGEGLNILTGETGAGKTIIIDSINALTGQRIDREMIRTGQERAYIEALFEVDGEISRAIEEITGTGPEADRVLIISREFLSNGRNTCRINGRLVPLSAIKLAGEMLIDMHGQHDNQSLMRPGTHVLFLDGFGGKRLNESKEAYKSLYGEYRKIRAKLEDIKQNSRERARREELYRFQSEEINRASPAEGEEEMLKEKRSAIVNAEKIAEALAAAYEMLRGEGRQTESALELVEKSAAALKETAQFHKKSEELAAKLEDIFYQLQEIAVDVREAADYTDYDRESLEMVEDRLELIQSLKKKYGDTVGEIMDYYTRICNELDELQSDSSNIKALEAEYEETGEKLKSAADILTQIRSETASVLSNNIVAELEELEMKKASFSVSVTDIGEYGPDGADKIEFLISPNPGEPLKPLLKIASGGEMSRIMLALKTILAEADRIPVLVFDEIDAGIGGNTAVRVAEKLSMISGTHQVICVTHLPQIACMADRHILISKSSSDDGMTRTQVKALGPEQSLEQLAVMLGGKETGGAAYAHAAELRKNALAYIENTRNK
ncbi:MAG: DNA repair protein RecN [Eubacteriales bacterium]|nr:DNA repair protein RecN [Eubacteriales bacterium]